MWRWTQVSNENIKTHVLSRQMESLRNKHIAWGKKNANANTHIQKECLERNVSKGNINANPHIVIGLDDVL